MGSKLDRVESGAFFTLHFFKSVFSRCTFLNPFFNAARLKNTFFTLHFFKSGFLRSTEKKACFPTGRAGKIALRGRVPAKPRPIVGPFLSWPTRILRGGFSEGGAGGGGGGRVPRLPQRWPDRPPAKRIGGNGKQLFFFPFRGVGFFYCSKSVMSSCSWQKGVSTLRRSLRSSTFPTAFHVCSSRMNRAWSLFLFSSASTCSA